MFSAYFLLKPIQQSRKHFDNAAKKGVEAIGLFAGNVYVYNNKKYVVIEEYITAENESSALHTRFSRNAFKKIAEKYSGKPFVIWAHSHPDYGCFLSSQDLSTHASFFNEEYHLAFVVDPIRKKEKLFKVEGEKYYPVSYAVVTKK